MVGEKNNARKLIESEWIDIIKSNDKGITAYGYAKRKKYYDLIRLMSHSDDIENESIPKNVEEDLLGMNRQEKEIIPNTNFTISSQRISTSSSFNSFPNGSLYNHDRDRQLDEMDVYGEIGREVEEKGWYPNNGTLGIGEIYACTIYINGTSLKVKNNGDMLKIGKEYYISTAIFDEIANTIQSMQLFIKKLEDIFNPELEQEIDDKGIKLKYSIERMVDEELKSEDYYHLESIINYGTISYFYTNRLQQEIYIVSDIATKIKDYGYVLLSHDGIMRNLKYEKLFTEGEEVVESKILTLNKNKKWISLGKDDYNEKIFNHLYKVFNSYLYLIPRDSGGEDKNEKMTTKNFIIIEILNCDTKIALVRPGIKVKNSIGAIRKREFLQSLFTLNKIDESFTINIS
eukprot:jgi/Orpsp1_1/1180260/evm.model.c7180000072699.1